MEHAINTRKDDTPRPQHRPTVPDIRVENHGSIVLFFPETDAGQEWIDANLNPEPWQWFGRGLAVEPRYAGPVIESAMDDGLEVA
jgi:hypothetical protein